MEEFLDFAVERFELILYTASTSGYADVIINKLETKRKYFAHRLYNQHCLQKSKAYSFKYLELLCGNRDMKDVLLVDNSVKNYA